MWSRFKPRKLSPFFGAATLAVALGVSLHPAPVSADGNRLAAGPRTVRKSVLCSLYLLSAAERGRIASLKEQNTAEAVTEMRKFRYFDLSVGDVRGGSRPVRATTSRDVFNLPNRLMATKRRIADRARGVENFHREHGGNTVTGAAADINSEWIGGFTIRGKDAILKYLDSEGALEARLTDAVAPTNTMDRMRAVGAAIYYWVTFSMALQQDVQIADHLSWMLAGFLIGGDFPYFAWKSIDLTERRVENEFRLALERATPGSWVFDSFDSKLRSQTVKNLIEHSDFDGLVDSEVETAANQERAPWVALAFPPLMEKLGLVKLGQPGAPSRNFYQKTWVMTDRVLRFDGQGEPALSIVVRTSFEKPKRPTPVKQTEFIEETETVLSPVYVRPNQNGD